MKSKHRPAFIGLLAFTLLLLLTSPSRTLADSLAASQATLDWSGLTFTLSGSLVATAVQAVNFACSGASTAGTSDAPAVGGFSGDCKYSFISPQGWSNTSASSAYSAPTGSAATQAATVNGFLTSSSQAATASSVWSRNIGQSSAETITDFWLYGSGVGSLIVRVPYTLSAVCNVAGGLPNQEATADSSVSLFLWNGNVSTASESLSCQDNLGIRNGFLTASIDFDNPYWGPLAEIDASVETDASASVPEPSTGLLLGSGFLVLVGIVKRKFLRYD